MELIISTVAFNKLKNTHKSFLNDVLGILPEVGSGPNILLEVLDILLEIRKETRAKKSFVLSDYIRQLLEVIEVRVSDDKESTTYAFN